MAERRQLIALVIRDGFNHITAGAVPLFSATEQEDTVKSRKLQEFVEAGLLKPGNLLDPVEPEWVVIDGISIFETLDEATDSLGVTNLSGEDFWALEDGDNLIPLAILPASSH
ncbi:Uncharacterised protein [Corynebacterium striatum]|uniref:hypothetical protein n=1 Tax=Corynebacterium striatum TaxID=43770 RepID=UPI000DF94688|nr:hypothetical protein [Corynebacterium striatum]STD34911.1 Uncharacterised protein [Corynebacterium striatum]